MIIKSIFTSPSFMAGRGCPKGKEPIAELWWTAEKLSRRNRTSGLCFNPVVCMHGNHVTMIRNSCQYFEPDADSITVNVRTHHICGCIDTLPISIFFDHMRSAKIVEPLKSQAKLVPADL
jgi:hypothetical protein